jgi:hypothetical protein
MSNARTPAVLGAASDQMVVGVISTELAVLGGREFGVSGVALCRDP